VHLTVCTRCVAPPLISRAELRPTVIELNGRFLRVPSVSHGGFWTTKPDGSAQFQPETGLDLELSTPEPGDFSSVARSAPLAGRIGSGRVVLRVTPAAHDWVEGLAAHVSLSLSDLLWQSLIRKAEDTGYYARPPARYLRRRHPNRLPNRPREVSSDAD
jgi:hypothetical protein